MEDACTDTMADDEYDLEELTALLDENSSGLPENSVPGSDGTDTESKNEQTVSDEMDAETIAAFLDEDSNEADHGPDSLKDDTSKPDQQAVEECDPQSIAAFLAESDDENDDNTTSDAKLIEKDVVDALKPDSAAASNQTQVLQAELLSMQKRMLELQQMLSQQTDKSTPSQSVQPLDESQEANPFFASEVMDKKMRPKNSTKPSSCTSTVKDKRAEPGKKSSNSTVEQANRHAMKKDLFGDSDSDAEDMDGEKPGLSEQGKKIKGLLKSGAQPRVAHLSKGSPEIPKKPSIDWKTKNMVTRESLGLALPSVQKKPSGQPEEKFVIDPFSGIRVVKPLVSSNEMEVKMNGRKIIKLSRLHLKVNTVDMQGDWVTIGVVVQKTEPKQSSSGKTFCIWKLSDLDNCDQVVSFFLFGQTYKEHWKNDTGSVIGLLNPSLMDNADKGNKDVAFTINNPKQLLMMGRSKDLGYCSGRTKKGIACNRFINKKFGDFCSYHVQSAYRKTSATRSELQGSVTGVTPKSFQNKMQPQKGSFYFYGGQTFTSLPNMKGNACKKKDGVTIQKLQVEQQLNKKKVTTMSLHEINPDGAAMKKAAVQEKEQAFLDMLSTPTVGSLNFVKHLVKQENNESSVVKEKPIIQSITPKQLIQQHKREMIERRKLRAMPKPSVPVDPLKLMPSLGKGFQNKGDIFLDFSPSRKPSKATTNDIEFAKRKAIAKISAQGGISKEDPNAVKKVSPNIERVQKRVLENTASDNKHDESAAQEPPKKRSRLLGNVDINSPEFQKLLKAKSSHKGALAEAESEREEKYFTELEKKEKMEDKMQSIMKLEVTVVTCKKCNYTAFTAGDLCKKENHALTRHKGMKRFFKCKKCQHRTISLDKYPKEACRSCGSSSFERTCMAREKTGPKLESETLCLRGDEEKFLGSFGGKSFSQTL